jgi:hypothetical protein
MKMRREMKRIQATAVGLLVCAVGAFSAAPALAFSPPEVGRCKGVAAGKGKFSSSSCTIEKAGGSYEWTPGAVKAKFKTKGGLGTLETKSGTTVQCKTETSGGEFTGTKAVAGVVVKFNECSGAGFKCSTAGSKEGELVTKTLEGVIGVEKKGLTAKANKIAFDLFPAGKTGFFIEFACGTLTVKVKGSVLVPITTTNKMQLTLVLKYAATSGRQKPEGF